MRMHIVIALIGYQQIVQVIQQIKAHFCVRGGNVVEPVHDGRKHTLFEQWGRIFEHRNGVLIEPGRTKRNGGLGCRGLLRVEHPIVILIVSVLVVTAVATVERIANGIT